MKCGDNERCTKSQVKRKNTKKEQSKHGPQQKLEVRSQIRWRSEHSLLTGVL